MSEFRVMPALCLDLDNTVRYSLSGEFIDDPKDMALFDGVEEKIWEWRDNGYLIAGISNQGGIAHGVKGPLAEEREFQHMLSLFTRNPFHIVKRCYHHEKGSVFPYNHRSLSRKPDIGMLVQIELDAFGRRIVVDWNNSLMVGDRAEDELCARRAGIGFRWAWEFFGRPQP